ncbi:MAG: bifunctional folylpolyglutamate synthase/dihydrofolate synthase [Bacteroidales bacterium]|nr:bifunctional folylpolyglutamate synthase/dihydrofolate synthase [Bacteroidales bacterium]
MAQTPPSARYNSVIQALFERHPSFQNVGGAAYKPGLVNMLLIDGLLGHPHRQYKCIHIAGTNGKGSVSNMMAAALASLGYKVGLYTSPHLLDFRERMRVVHGKDFRLISREEVLEFLDKWQGDCDRIGLSFFEITTMMAFDWFARQKVDVAVIETGLGGRLDSTNILSPILSIITNIGLDHCDLLGNTLPEIAFEKAGIIKPLAPVVIGEGNEEINPVFEKKVLYTNLPEPSLGGDRKQILSLLHFANEKYTDEPQNEALLEGLLKEMDLPGDYQKANLRTVLYALEVLSTLPGFSPLKATREEGLREGGALRNALIHTASITGFHGRWETVRKHPQVICDIGHNAHGLRYNFAALQREIDRGRRVILVYGSVSDKDVSAAVQLLPKGAVILLAAAENPRAMKPEAILELIRKNRATDACNADSEPLPTCIPTVRKAVARALRLAKEDDLIYIGGSTYLVAEALRALEDE